MSCQWKDALNNITSLAMKTTTLECVAHKFFMNLYKHNHSVNKCKMTCLLSKWYNQVTKITLPAFYRCLQTSRFAFCSILL